MRPSLLILGGTAEGYDLAEGLAALGGIHVISSLAGRTKAPRLPLGRVRIGGFGGVDGLVGFLRDQQITAVIDATHPFAARMGNNAHQACAQTKTPLLRLERAPWVAEPGDRWDFVDQWDQADLTDCRRVLAAVGRQDLAAFHRWPQIWFLIRAVTIPDDLDHFAQAEFLAARGPFSLDQDVALLTHHAIDTVLCKNSGGSTDAKLLAARQLGLRVILQNRPPRPRTDQAHTVPQALAWLSGILPDQLA